MPGKLRLAVPLLILCNVLTLRAKQAAAQSVALTLTQLCAPKVIASKTVASAKQRIEAGQKADPPHTAGAVAGRIIMWAGSR